MNKYLLFIFILGFSSSNVFSQIEGKDVLPPRKYIFLPSLGAGVGFSKFIGDISDKKGTNVHWLGNKVMYDFAFSANLSNSFYFNANLIVGKLSGNENGTGQHRNFETSMMNAGLNLEYSFGGLNKKVRPLITPFLSAGIYYGSYTSRTDLYDEKGNLYYYWSDGKIKDIAEDASNAENAINLSRDYNYETKLSSKPVNTFSAPLGAGIDLHAGKRLVFRLSSKYFFTFSDNLENFDANSSSIKKDGYLYSSVSLYFNIIPDRSNYVPKELLRELNADDYDIDGVADLEDECGGTPQGVSVNEKGCPIDGDNDGIPDYLDSEPNSPTSEVGTDGVIFDFLKIAQNAEDSLSILHALIKKYPNLLLKNVDQNFTVYAGTFNQSNKAQKLFLQSIPGVKETQLNDSLFVYTVGSYTQFEEAEQKKNELQMKGVNHAFEAPSSVLNEVAGDLDKMLKDTIETPESRKAKEEKYLAEISANSKPFGKEGDYANVSPVHSDEKHGFADKIETEVKQDAVAAVSVVEKEEPKAEIQKEVAEEITIPLVQEKEPEIKEVKNDVPKAVVKFSVDVVEHSDKPLPFDVLLLMQRETLTMQTVRVMGAKIFTVGNYNSVSDAQKVKAELLSLGATDATIIGSINSIKVTQKEAEEMLKKIGQ